MIVLPVILMILMVIIIIVMVIFETWEVSGRIGRIWRLFLVIWGIAAIDVVVGVAKGELILEIVGFGISFTVVVIGAADWDHASDDSFLAL